MYYVIMSKFTVTLVVRAASQGISTTSVVQRWILVLDRKRSIIQLFLCRTKKKKRKAQFLGSRVNQHGRLSLHSFLLLFQTKFPELSP